MFPRVLIVFLLPFSLCSQSCRGGGKRHLRARRGRHRPSPGGEAPLPLAARKEFPTHAHPCQTLEQAKHRSFLLILLCSFFVLIIAQKF